MSIRTSVVLMTTYTICLTLYYVCIPVFNAVSVQLLDNPVYGSTPGLGTMLSHLNIVIQAGFAALGLMLIFIIFAVPFRSRPDTGRISALGARLRLAAVGLDIAGFFLSLFFLGLLYTVFGELQSYLNTWQQANYPVGVFIQYDLFSWQYGWAALPVIFLISLVIGLVLDSQKRNLQGARL